MAAKNKKKSKKAQQTAQQAHVDQSGAVVHSSTVKTVKGEDLIDVSPSRVRFQHSKIRPVFSGCGRSVLETLEEIRRGSLEPGDLPPIQVIIGPDENDGSGPWYFSLNNRRLWVLKQCYKEGLLDNERYNNTIPVRVRMPKSEAEAERYSIDNCALEAKFMREGGSGGGKSKKKKKGKGKKGAVQCGNGCDSDVGGELDMRDGVREPANDLINERAIRDEEDNEIKSDKQYDISKSEDASDSESESDGDISRENPFSALF
mmetsp:Transcript_20936/g.38402  ORF Transcript_20936/g.38402 Transcript_20936/m.38402 type:complete len:260 (-) Transcript_20936:48-827(-)|eukprot:CAMPEP_0202022490 /NCGR_PEP_ID=MMETSP0905-20130828/49687_1 /ASSEMBLY_ACC=CAM_ASM_000554 /TAXON_ID=420261 /ORGANISM="Thalassiosira antarctica, Strain CCMP982" /LENGTH=259 /DNA_ID=CAMNT_0048584643 /DNA_START=46 /DNA_END=825 /DNA_ORIENTATION=-